ncbi:ribonuclease BN [Streptomyces sp. CB02923]|uniref:YhjD/YihY/BrkB family envelope integrity protein n=1 Tax=Streptomyces sp. CB02923 TaxID=1718985 RepID=UPI00093AAA41|nr:YhjD/YihY/BrkB family envelope integrity protein [Streptomyces sp. CB02923]OKI02666.1 ribonuclease BN [Streptomyces sp. CB02923]
MAISGLARPLAGRVVRQLVGVHILDLATRLAAQAFLAALPMLIAVSSLCPYAVRQELLRSLRSLVGSDSPLLVPVEAVHGYRDQALHSWGAAGALVALLSATAFTRVLQRVCERSWNLPHSGARIVAWRWALWLVVWIVALLYQGMLHRAFGAGAALGVPLQLAGAVLMWWWTQHLLLAGRVPWMPLLPGALLTGGGAVAFSLSSGLWLPRVLAHSVERYGPLGSVFTLLSWLILFFVTVVAGIAAGQVLAHDEASRDRPGPPDVPSR